MSDRGGTPSGHDVPERGTFVGRESQREVLRNHVIAARAGNPRIVRIDGEPGIGKTSLIQSFLRELAPDTTVVWASGDQGEVAVDYAIVDQLMRGLVHQPHAHGGSEPSDVGAELLRLLGAASEDALVVLVVDDVHWADLQSQQALAFALRRLRTDAVLAVFGGRPGYDLHPSLARTLEEPPSERLRLPPFTAEEVVHVARHHGVPDLSLPAARRLRDHTAGNALHVTTLLQELEPVVVRRSGGPLPAPRSFELLIAEKLAECDDDTVALVQAAAVLDRGAPLALVAEVARLVDAADALDEAVAHDLLEISPDRRIAVTHPLVRAAIGDHTPHGRRAELHRRVAALVDEETALRHLVAATSGADEELAGRLEMRARSNTARGRWQAAANHLLLAAQVTGPAPQADRLRLEAAGLLIVTGDAGKAADLIDDVAVPAENEGLHALVAGHLALVLGDHERSEKLLLSGWELAGQQERTDVQMCAAATQIAQLLLLRGRAGEALEWAERALATGRALGADPYTLRLAALVASGRSDQARMLADRHPGHRGSAVEDADRLLGRGLVHLWTERTDEAIEDLRAAADVQGGWRPLRTRTLALGYLAEAEFRCGLWDDTLGDAELAWSLAVDADHRWLHTWLSSLIASVLGLRGRWDEAEAKLEMARSSLVPGDAASTAYFGIAGARGALARSRPSEALRWLEPVVEFPHRGGVDQPGMVGWQPLHAEALADVGRTDDALAVLRRVEASTDLEAPSPTIAAHLRVRGNVALGLGQLEEATAHYRRGLSLIEGFNRPFERAQLEEGTGRALRRQGLRRAAASHLDTASRLYGQLGAAPYLQRVRDELAVSGRSISRAATSHPTELTPQELRVTRLVAQGLTNRAVAADLVVSVKTVEYHLGNVFRKTGSRSRTALAVWFEQQRSTAPGNED